MASFLEKLPTILVLCILLGMFLSLRKHAKSRPIGLCILGWTLILLHFVAQTFEAAPGWRGHLGAAVDLSGLELAGIVFVAFSARALVEDRRRRAGFFLMVGLPALVHSVVAAIPIERPWIHAVCLAAIFFGSAIVVVRCSPRWSARSLSLLALLLGVGTWSMVQVLQHAYENGTVAVLALGFGVPGIAFYRNYKRCSPGVVSTTAGFLCWGAVFPLAATLEHFFPNATLSPELWNVPKFFVAFGMILTLVEDKSLSLLEARGREYEASQQLQKFASITSRLLTGADPKLMCQESAEVIAEFSNFRRVAIELCDDEGRLLLVGESGLSEEARRELVEKVLHWTSAEIAQLCSVGKPVGPNSFLLKIEQLAKYHPVRSVLQYEANPHWENGDEILVPLRSTKGRYLGLIAVDDPRDVTRVGPQELSKIELLAADLAISIENAALQRQLIRSEKLAAVGKLVSGVAHELNNPLTAIEGYTELLLDETTSDGARKRLEKIGRESHRMQVIIENLLRFARRTTVNHAPLDVEAILREAIALFQYQLHGKKIALHIQIEAALPRVVGDENQLKQVFVNLLGNALEAVQSAVERHIGIELLSREEKIIIRFLDSGPGFADVNRVFDPFYTTKPVGKGTGLGLSSCYGLVKEHGGEIFAENLFPCGAGVTVELPRWAMIAPVLASAAGF
jgi:two-component system NtrC family sensor kinase